MKSLDISLEPVTITYYKRSKFTLDNEIRLSVEMGKQAYKQLEKKVDAHSLKFKMNDIVIYLETHRIN